MNSAYLDNNSTTRPLPEVIVAVCNAFADGYGNASSIHSGGEFARDVLRNTREEILELLGTDAGEIIFTSGGTESNNQVLQLARGVEKNQNHIVTSVIEHSSVLKTCEFWERMGCRVTYVAVGKDGRIDLQAFEEATRIPTQLVSIQWVNNETGTIQPIEELSELCKDRRILLHTDAAQAIGKLPIDLARHKIDFLTFTGHKIHAPQGVGVIWSKNKKELRPLIHGGGQEYLLRAGTENIPGIAGLQTAVAIRRKSFASAVAHMTQMRDEFEKRVLENIPGVSVNGSVRNRVCNTTNLQFRGIDGQALVARLDQSGVHCSQSSACTNQRPEPSYVLRSIGLTEEEAYSSVRFSFSELNTRDEIKYAVGHLVKICASLRDFRSRTGT